MSERRALKWIEFWPFAALGALAVVFVFMLVFSRKAPIIASLDPPMAAPGQQVVVTGDYFGRTEREGSLSLAGEIPPPSLILSWSDQRIVFVVPGDASSGLVTVSNSQGTSTGVLFTNTETIPTVLQAAAPPAVPLVWVATPFQPVPGQLVTLTGRSFGRGDEAVQVRIATPNGGPRLEISPAESLTWSDRSLTFRWPPGADTGTTVVVSTPQGDSAPLAYGGPGPVVFEQPRTVVVEVKAKVSQPASTAVVLWGPVPQRSTGTAWSVNPELITAGSRGPLFAWPAGSSGERQVSYKLTLTTWARRWDGLPAGSTPSVQDVPAGDEEPRSDWKPAAATLKALTAKWGLETPDPWLRVQRLQTGLAAAFRASVGSAEAPHLSLAPAPLLASGSLSSYEISSLAVYLAGQAGLSARLVGGLWVSDGVVSRTWAEVWIAGAGWVSWDVIDGSPGSLDNRHFAFETDAAAPVLRQPRSKKFGSPPPGSLRGAAGEASGPGPEPIVQWQITRLEK